MKNFIFKVNRWTGWLSLAFMAVFTLTGFAMAGMWGMDNVIGVRRAAWLHSTPYMIYPMVTVVLIHSLLCAQRTVVRWLAKK